MVGAVRSRKICCLMLYRRIGYARKKIPAPDDGISKQFALQDGGSQTTDGDNQNNKQVGIRKTHAMGPKPGPTWSDGINEQDQEAKFLNNIQHIALLNVAPRLAHKWPTTKSHQTAHRQYLCRENLTLLINKPTTATKPEY